MQAPAPRCKTAGTFQALIDWGAEPRHPLPLSPRTSMSDAITHVTDESFDPEVLKSDVPVLVDYWADWCGPCKAIAPILDQLAKEYEGKLKVVKINVDENQETPKKYNVRGI